MRHNTLDFQVHVLPLISITQQNYKPHILLMLLVLALSPFRLDSENFLIIMVCFPLSVPDLKVRLQKNPMVCRNLEKLKVATGSPFTILKPRRI